LSGIVGIINLDGAPVDRQLLKQMTEFMAYRGPDAREMWAEGPVGFGHTMLRTTEESLTERQPCSLDGQIWITADARVDARQELVAELEARGRRHVKEANDAELILHSYHVWGEYCVEHLMGDFAFAIWDGTQRQLFCARDQFGVKPFYYAAADGALVFSNTLNCLRRHPAVSNQLNQLAIADFLLFGLNQDPATTTFADIQRLPPAHCLTWSPKSRFLRRYWQVPIEEPIRFKRQRDYVEHFLALLRLAVADRLRTNRLGVFMSGGLDSPGLAAVARQLLSNRCSTFDLRAYTVVYDRLIPDEERYYAGLAAEALDIPIQFLEGDGYALYERWDRPEMCRPEPEHNPLLALTFDQLQQLSTHSRVAFYGEGPDNLLRYEWRPYIRQLLRQKRLGRLTADLWCYVSALRRLPFWRRIANRWHSGSSTQHTPPSYPGWIHPEFAARLHLQERWEQVQRAPPPAHPVRPKAYISLSLPNWQSLFEGYDAGITRVPVEVRHPYMDLRLVRYLLAVPPIPWCVNKYLPRTAFRGTLAEPIRRRRKTPLMGDPVLELWRETAMALPGNFHPRPELAQYVVVEAIQGPDAMWMNLRPHSLNLWFQYSPPAQTSKENASQEEYHGLRT
jgi:asparagine synthase (glutamine-hydrolysing)